MKSPTQLLSSAFTTFRENIQLFFSIFIIPTIIALPIMLLIAQAEHGVLTLMLLPLLGIGLAIINILMSIAMVKAVIEPKETTWRSAYAYAKEHFLSYLWVMILVVVITGFGFVLLIVPGILFIVWYSFSVFTLLIEGKRGMDALRGSREYVRGKWFPVFGRLLFLMVIALLISFVFGIVFGINDTNRDELIPQIVGQLLNFVFIPVSLAYVYQIYLDLKNVPSVIASSTASHTEEKASEEPS